MAAGGEGGGDGLLRGAAHAAGPRRRGGTSPDRFLAAPAPRTPKRPPLLDEFGVRGGATAGAGTGSPGRTRDATSPIPSECRDWLLAYLREDAAQAAPGQCRRPAEGRPRRAARPAQRAAARSSTTAASPAPPAGTTWTAGTPRSTPSCPSARRAGAIEELMALIEAGVLEVLGPRLEVRDGGRGLGGALPRGAGLGGAGDGARRGAAAGAGPAPQRRRPAGAAAEDRASAGRTPSTATRPAGWTSHSARTV